MLYIYATTFSIYKLYAWLEVINEPERFVTAGRLCPEVVVMRVTAATR